MSATRQRAYRQRRREGYISVRVAVPHVETVQWLVEHGLLSSADEEDRDKISAALERAGARIVFLES